MNLHRSNTFQETENPSTFGVDFQPIWPQPGSNIELTAFGSKLLQQCRNIERPNSNNVDLQEFMEISNNFPIEFMCNSNRVKSQPLERLSEIKKQIASAYPVIHERVLGLYLAFLEHKCLYGNVIELQIYPKLSLTDFVQRLLEKRCVSFCDPEDQYYLMSGEFGDGGFLEIGTLAQKPPLTLDKLISYDEMKLSAFLSTSSYSEFINDGSRLNCGRIETDKSKIEREGVIIGLIGGRFHKENVMEYQDIIISEDQNIMENGYGLKQKSIPNNKAQSLRHIWRQFYEEKDFVYSDMGKVEDPRFSKIFHSTCYFDNLVMKKRYTISFDTLLLESEARAVAANKQAFIHVVGIGLGVWATCDSQEKVFLETFAQRLKVLVPNLSHVAIVHFSWFKLTEWKDLKNGGTIECETHPNGGIKTFLSNRNPAEKLKSPEQDNMLPIVSWAWDSNSLPGNEFWVGGLSNSSDSAAAGATLITELHNPHINSLMISGSNLHIASEKHGVIHISDYAKKIFN